MRKRVEPVGIPRIHAGEDVNGRRTRKIPANRSRTPAFGTRSRTPYDRGARMSFEHALWEQFKSPWFWLAVVAGALLIPVLVAAWFLL